MVHPEMCLGFYVFTGLNASSVFSVIPVVEFIEQITSQGIEADSVLPIRTYLAFIVW